jgi:3-oxoacyl-[acyl-carrier-protein] synthase II
MASTRDKTGRPIVVVTGRGVITSLGAGKSDNWTKLTAGQSGIKAITRFSTEGLRTRIAGTIDYLPAQPCTAALSESFATIAAEEAIAEAGIGARGDFPGPLFIAVPPIEMEWPQRIELGARCGANQQVTYSDLLRVSGEYPAYHERFQFASVADHLADTFGTKGSPISLSTACASGASAIQLGVEAIRRGETDAALCIGTDGSINPESLIRFSLLSALSTSNDNPQKAARPFAKNRDGFVMAEGAGALVLESYESAKARGATILAIIEGCGEMADSFHRTRSSPDGKPIIGCIANALKDAGLSPDEVDYVNAHGTGTPENDKMEHLGLSAVFGERTKTVPISSNKSMVGHTLSAAGAVEAVFTLLTLEHQRIPPTINYDVPDPAIPLDVVPNAARDARVRHAISNSIGFGGQNVSLVMGREPA